MRDVMLICDFCGAEKPLEELFKCYYCKKICCDDHVNNDDMAICTECREKNNE